MAWTTPITYTAGAILTAAQLNTNLRDNTNALYDSVRRLGYQTRTTDYAVDQTAIGSAANIFSTSITFTADGTSSYLLECMFPAVDSLAANRQVILHFTDGSSTSLVKAIAGVTGGAGSQVRTAVHARIPWTPTSGSKTVNMRAINTGGAGSIFMDSATWTPGFMAVWGTVL
jgi:hypothetical protein